MNVLFSRMYIGIFLFFTLSGFSYSQSQERGVLNFSVYSTVGLGNIGEYVYNGEHTLSYLEWELLPVGGIGIDLDYIAANGFYIGGGYESFLPGKTGRMEDSDWMTIGSDEKTHFSAHDAYLTGGYSADVRLGLQLLNNEAYRALLYFGYMQKYFSMEGREGYTEYPPDYEREPVYGVGIAYMQLYRIPHLGFQFGKTLNRRFLLNFHGRFSPFTSIFALDHHYKVTLDNRQNDFYDTMRNGVFFEAEGEVELLVKNNQSFFLALSYTCVPEFRGSTYIIDTVTGERSPTYENSGGASLSLFQMQLGYRIMAGD